MAGRSLTRWPTWWELRREALDDALRGVVADIGAGSGSTVDPASAQPVHGCRSARLIHVDDASLGTGPCHRVRADIERGLPLRDGCLDAVVCNHVLEHLADSDALIADLARTLRPGGWAIVAVPNGRSLSDGLFRAWYRATHLRGGRYRGHVHRWRLAEVIAALEHVGLDVRAVTRIGESYSWLHKHRLARGALLGVHRLGARFAGEFFAYGWHLVAQRR